MTVENGGEQPANDTVLPVENDTTTQAAENTEAEDTESEEGDSPAEDEEELDLDGEKYRIPRKVREAIAKPYDQDYRRKTEELANGRKAFETEREGFTKQQDAQRAHFETAAKVIAYNDQIKSVEANLAQYANVDWATLSQTNPGLYEQHRVNRDLLRDQKETLKDQRDTAARTWTEKEQEYTSNANRERGERVAKAQAELPKLIKDWSPELDTKLQQFGNGLGFSNQELTETTIRNPVFARELNRLRLYDEAAKKQKTAETFEASQAAKPVTRVGGNSGTALRRTTDASGDALSNEEWVRRENERLAKVRAAR